MPRATRSSSKKAQQAKKKRLPAAATPTRSSITSVTAPLHKTTRSTRSPSPSISVTSDDERKEGDVSSGALPPEASDLSEIDSIFADIDNDNDDRTGSGTVQPASSSDPAPITTTTKTEDNDDNKESKEQTGEEVVDQVVDEAVEEAVEEEDDEGQDLAAIFAYLAPTSGTLTTLRAQLEAALAVIAAGEASEADAAEENLVGFCEEVEKLGAVHEAVTAWFERSRDGGEAFWNENGGSEGEEQGRGQQDWDFEGERRRWGVLVEGVVGTVKGWGLEGGEDDGAEDEEWVGDGGDEDEDDEWIKGEEKAKRKRGRGRSKNRAESDKVGVGRARKKDGSRATKRQKMEETSETKSVCGRKEEAQKLQDTTVPDKKNETPRNVEAPVAEEKKKQDGKEINADNWEEFEIDWDI